MLLALAAERQDVRLTNASEMSMGVTIHYEGIARSDEDLEALLAVVRSEASRAGWAITDLSADNAVLERVIDEAECNYRGRVRGLAVQPHPEAEPLHFVFDDDLFLQDYCKTQFAGVATHVAIVTLLRRLEPYFDDLRVVDEGEFWENDDLRGLEAHFDAFNRALAELVAQRPDAHTKVRLPSGRIIDAST